jgi:hypothetical protein
MCTIVALCNTLASYPITMKNSPDGGRRIYAPRSTTKRKRVPIGLDPAHLARCKTRDAAENMTDAAYVLEVYLEGQARRQQRRTAAGGLEAR